MISWIDRYCGYFDEEGGDVLLPLPPQWHAGKAAKQAMSKEELQQSRSDAARAHRMLLTPHWSTSEKWREATRTASE